MTLADTLLQHAVFAGLESPPLASRHGTELFVAVGLAVRVCMASRAAPHMVLDLPAVTYPITSLVINASGTLLAVVGSHDVVVVALPAAPFTQSTRQVHTFPVALASPHTVLAAAWHPAAHLDATLVTLSLDRVVRSHDVVAGKCALFLLAAPGHLFLPDAVLSPVSLAFGLASSAVGALTLYVLSGDGEVYCLYPFMPSELAVPQEWAEQLFDEAVYAAQAPGTADGSTRSQALAQLQYVLGLWKQATSPVGEKEVRATDPTTARTLCVVRPDVIPPHPQGPLVMAPFRDALYDAAGVAMVAVPCGQVVVVACLWLDGTVAVCVQDPGLCMAWAAGTGVPSLTVVEYVDVPRATAPGLLVALETQHQFAVVGGGQVHVVDVASWGQVLEEAVASGDIQRFVLVVQSGRLGTRVTRVPAEGGAHAAVLSQDGREYVVAAARGRACVVDVGSASSSSVSLRGNGDVDETGAESLRLASLLAAPFGGVESLVAGLSLREVLQVPTARPKDTDLADDEATFADVSVVAETALGKVVALSKAGYVLHDRAGRQQREVRRQVRELEELEVLRSGNDGAVEAAMATMAERLQAAHAWGTRFSERLGAVQRRLDEARVVAMPLSSQERQWVEELERVSALVENGQDGLAVQLQQLRAQVSVAQRLEAAMGDALSQVSWLDLRYLKQYLTDEAKVIGRARELIREKQQVLDTLEA